MKNTIDVKCPFCGSGDLYVEQPTDGGETYDVMCRSCGGSGPPRFTQDLAIAAFRLRDGVVTEKDVLTKKFPSQRLAELAYDAYGRTTDFKNYQGLPMPSFNDLPDKIQEAWCNAVMAVKSEVSKKKQVIFETGIGA